MKAGKERRLMRALAPGVEDRVSRDRWLVSYADLLTLLFALFAVLLAVSHKKADGLQSISASIRSSLSGQKVQSLVEGAPPPSTVPASLAGIASAHPDAELAAELRAVLQSSVEMHQASVEETPEGIVLSFPESGLFASGAAQMLPGTGGAILAAGRLLAARGAAVRVEGHSDDQPIDNALYHSNWELSAARAMAVLSLLVREAGYDPTHLSMAGYGPYRPVADNSTAEGRRRNRRVDLVVLLGSPAAKESSAAAAAVAR